jgi:hypothetical protein
MIDQAVHPEGGAVQGCLSFSWVGGIAGALLIAGLSDLLR